MKRKFVFGWAALLLGAGLWTAAAQAYGPPPGPGWGPVYRPAWGPWYGGPRWYGGWYGGWYGPRVGVTIGGPWGWPYSYPYPVYTAPQVVVVPQTVPVPYVEQPTPPPAQPAAPAAQQTLWFYCTNPAGYYPYVQNCTQAWIPVRPQDVQPAPR